MNSDYVEIDDVKVVRLTPNSAVCEIEGEEYLIPFSQMDFNSIDRPGDEGTLIITRWLAERECLI